jgi:ATP-dependent Lon protease
VQNLEDGRLLIMTVGERRFRIHALHQDRAYYEASVEYLDFIDEAEAAAQEAADNLYPVFANFLDVLSDMDDSVQINSSNIPVEPRALTFTAAALLQSPMKTKQSLLEARRLTSILNYLRRVYEQEIDLLQQFPLQGNGEFLRKLVRSKRLSVYYALSSSFHIGQQRAVPEPILELRFIPTPLAAAAPYRAAPFPCGCRGW